MGEVVRLESIILLYDIIKFIDGINRNVYKVFVELAKFLDIIYTFINIGNWFIYIYIFFYESQFIYTTKENKEINIDIEYIWFYDCCMSYIWYYQIMSLRGAMYHEYSTYINWLCKPIIP